MLKPEPYQGKSSADVSVLLGNGDGTFETATNFNVLPNPLSVVVGNFNGDGRLDLVTLNQDFNVVLEGVYKIMIKL